MNTFRIIPLVSTMLLLALAQSAQGADVEKGQTVFKNNCRACHSNEPGKSRIGPSLFGVVGRPAGSVGGYNYSSGIKDVGSWTPENLEQFIQSPKSYVVGTKMAFAGLRDATERQDLIAYLESLR